MLSIENLVFKIGETSILDGVTVAVKKGENLGIIGPNGSGKTTLFNCLSGFNIPASGRILFNDQDITSTPPHIRAGLGIGRVFQNFGIFKEMTLLENILIAIESRGQPFLLPWSKAHHINTNKALEFLSAVNLDTRANEKASSLSGGQMRLLEISRCLAFGAELFLLDEPTAGVSPKMKREVEEVLVKLQQLEKTILIIEHDMNFVQKLCERIVVLDVGKVVLDGRPEVVRGTKLLQEIYFGATDNNPEEVK